MSWIFESATPSGVLGSFDLAHFVAWHDDTVQPTDCFNTILHEDIHARGIAGSYLHLTLVADAHNRILGSQDDLTPQYADFFHLHEAQPKAYDLLTGSNTSFYDDPAIVQRAEEVAALVAAMLARVRELAGETPELTYQLLRALFLALSDHYRVDDPPSARSLVRALHGYFDATPGRRAFPNGVDLHSGATTKRLRDEINFISRETLGHVVVNSSHSYLIANSFLLFSSALVQTENAQRRRAFRDLFLPVLNLIFFGAVVPHVAVRSDQRRINLTTSDYLIRRILLRASTGNFSEGDRALQEMKALHRSTMLDNRANYVHDGFLVKNVYDVDGIPDNAVYAYLSQLFGAFPAAYLNLCDEVFDSGLGMIAAEEQEHIFDLMQPVAPEIWKLATDNYWRFRHEIWRELGHAAADVVLWIVSSVLRSLDACHQRGEIDFSIFDEPIDVDAGQQQLFQLTPDDWESEGDT